jgi:hypothetical protein
MEGYDPRSKWQKAENKERKQKQAMLNRIAYMTYGLHAPVQHAPPEPTASFRGIPVFFEDIIRPSSILDEGEKPQSLYLHYFPDKTPILIQPVAIYLTNKEYDRLPVISNPSYIVAPKLRFTNVKEATEQAVKIVQNVAKICDANPVKSILIIIYRPVGVADSTILKYATTGVKPLLESPPSFEASTSAAAVDERTFEEMLAEAVAADAAEAAEAAKRAANTAASLSASLSAAAPKAAGGGGGPASAYSAEGTKSAYAYVAKEGARGGGGGPTMKKYRRTRRHRRT